VRGLVDEPAQSVLFEQVMHPAVTLAQIAAVASILCGLHAARGRIGMAPFLMTMGMLVVMLFVIGDFGLTINAPLFWSGGVPVDTALLLPLVLTGQVMVYIFDGTQAARRLLVGILCIQLLHHGLDELLVWYALEGAAPGSVPDARLPDLVRLSLAMLFAMLTDTLAYSGLLVQFGGVGGFPLVEKVQSVAAAALPTSAYVWFGLRYGEVSQLGGTERRALDVIDLRVKLAKTEARLVESEQRFADVRAVFSRYVSPEVVSAIVEDPSKVALGGEERDVTVLFADIAGYSSLAEVLKPKEVIGLLNQYFEQTATPILARRGMINEFEGDGILAIFGAPLSLKDHAAQALAAAREMLEAVERLNALWAADGTLARWEPSGVDRLRIRIGIHSGAVVAGNVGSAARIKYAVIGDTVNVAARVEALNKTLKTSLLVTAESVAEMGADAPKMEPRGLHPVKGRTELVEVFTLAV
jgi:class 3 adenylate cyclase